MDYLTLNYNSLNPDEVYDFLRNDIRSSKWSARVGELWKLWYTIQLELQDIDRKLRDVYGAYTELDAEKDKRALQLKLPEYFSLKSFDEFLRLHSVPSKKKIFLRATDLVIPAEVGTNDINGILIPSKYFFDMCMIMGLNIPDGNETGVAEIEIVKGDSHSKEKVRFKVGDYEDFIVTFPLGKLIGKDERTSVILSINSHKNNPNDPSSEFES